VLAYFSHLLVTHPSVSTALELLLLESSRESQHTAIQMQFIFQNYLAQFANAPSADRFRTCQDMFNRILKAQRGVVDPKFREYVGPAGIMVGGIMGTMAVPAIMGLSAQVASRQARRERTLEEEVEVRQPLHRSKSMNVKRAALGSPVGKDNSLRANFSASLDSRRPNSSGLTSLTSSPQRAASATHFSNRHVGLISQSQPNLRPASSMSNRPSHLRSVSPSSFTDENISRTLQTHYYSTQTQFLQCLQDISLRLRLVPKAARQSSLRIELGGLDKWLPADVCLANLCSSNDVHDRIVQVVENDCTILNSAERVKDFRDGADQGPLFITGGSIKRRLDILTS
jgi:phosphatidylinositol 4-kinase B